MSNMENYLVYTDYQFQLISHVLVFGLGAMVAGLIYFAYTVSSTKPKYRTTSYLGSVVMVSAALILWTQYESWTNAFTYVPNVLGEGQGGYVNANMEDGIIGLAGAIPEDQSNLSRATFSNGFRYMNWTIDVPMLQVQLLAVIGVAGVTFFRSAAKFVVGGLAMIYFSYTAQFFEGGFHPTLGDPSSRFYFWTFYLLGWVAFAYILYSVKKDVFDRTDHMHARARNVMRGIWWLFVGSWTAYGIAIAMPAFAFNAGGAVSRQFIFTFCDVVSKVIYGAMLARVATFQSAAEGFQPAMDECSWEAVTRGDVPDLTPDDFYGDQESSGRPAPVLAK
ncbi:Green-light absorbing proteorhodopsin precursor [Rubripirellula obstinata]|uniref:Green-light absorbing proteorhodopsin n=2 Tax=Rubripirellula obstinata TaxID=406547 RepID=A0A5B1CMS2_9BACT|nr:bacteriorhodopsin [Rubripirellula obstinata]KAA1261089.1 Green-light absorbing proteorhodopsin precursor [Rubripirellula obstinata]